MNTSSLKSKAASRRTTSTKPEWKCSYCNKSFVQEKAFYSHMCKGKIRLDQLKTPLGQAAYLNYNTWMKLTRKTEQNATTFMNSRYYESFIRFTEYCNRLNIDAPKFIGFIMGADPTTSPFLWCNCAVYSGYLEYCDSIHHPMDQVAESLVFLERKAEMLDCSLSEVLLKMGLPHVIEAFRLKKLSPWFLYTSNHGLAFLKSLDQDDYNTFEKIINSEAWAKRFSENRELLTEMQNILNA